MDGGNGCLSAFSVLIGGASPVARTLLSGDFLLWCLKRWDIKAPPCMFLCAFLLVIRFIVHVLVSSPISGASLRRLSPQISRHVGSGSDRSGRLDLPCYAILSSALV